ncbi:MAG: hypothetical protein ABI548_18535 [Polyangiaceae bacterium]
MRRLETGFSVVWLVAAAAASACGGSTTQLKDQNEHAAAGEAGASADPRDMSAGGETAAGAAGDAGASGNGGAAGTPDNACQPRQDLPPGVATALLLQPGSGACAGTTLADAVAQVRALRPDLSDVTELYKSNPAVVGDGSYIYAFAEAGGGFALAFKRGGGDCPAGCTVNDYWYFETDAACQIQAVGETHSEELCTPADQQPRWGVPATIAPRYICGADLSPVQLSGSYDLVTCGTASACSLGGDKVAPPRTLSSMLSLRIQQDPSDLSEGTVTLNGTGEPLLDAQPFPATFDRQSFTVHAEYSNLPAVCPESWQLDFRYDFEGFGARTLTFVQTQTPDCAKAPGANCKGGVSATLGDAHVAHD